LAQPFRFNRLSIVLVALCVGGLGLPGTALAQSGGSMDAKSARSLVKACGRTSTIGNCFKTLRGKLAWIPDLVLAELEAAPLSTQPTPAPPAMSTPKVVWDGTFAHPYAPSFYILKSYVADGKSPDACRQLPDALRTDAQRLLKLTCEAERELIAAGENRWPDEHAELDALRRRLGSCLPSQASNPTPCGTP
jgi:hypothetical protein